MNTLSELLTAEYASLVTNVDVQENYIEIYMTFCKLRFDFNDNRYYTTTIFDNTGHVVHQDMYDYILHFKRVIVTQLGPTLYTRLVDVLKNSHKTLPIVLYYFKDEMVGVDNLTSMMSNMEIDQMSGFTKQMKSLNF